MMERRFEIKDGYEIEMNDKQVLYMVYLTCFNCFMFMVYLLDSFWLALPWLESP